MVCVLALLSVFLALPVMAQTVNDTQFRAGAFGLGYFSGGDPALMGKAALFLPIGSTTNTVSFSATDIGIVKTGGQIQVAQFHLSYRLQSGLAYRVYQNKWIELWGLAAPGFVANGVNLQAAFQYGAAVGIKTGKSGTGPEILLPLAADTVVATKFNPAVMVAFRF
jgi:hypothetical protein